MKRFLLFILCLVATSSCSSSRWVVTDQHAVDMENEPVILNEKYVLLLQNQPSVDNPVLSFIPYKVVEKEYQERVKVERSVQKYRPKWKFLVLGGAGAIFAAIAGNTNLLLPSVSGGQQVAFNLSAALLAGLAFTNMEPVGDPIFTGESQLQRRSGSEVISDTLQTDSIGEALDVDLEIIYQDETIFSESNIQLTDGSFDINLATFLEYLDDTISEESSIEVNLAYNGSDSSYVIPVTDFLAPFVTITEPIAILRNTPRISELNVVTEVGNNSSLELISQESDDWYRVRFGSSEVFLSTSAGEVEWMSEAESGSPDIFEFTNIPFGEIDVENSVPVLKQNNQNDRAIILTNGLSGYTELRQYLSRDHELFRFYMRYALQMDEEQIYQVEMDSTGSWKENMRTVTEMDSTETLILYLSGSAHIDDSDNIHMTRLNTEASDSSSGLATFLLNSIERMNPSSVVVFADLDFSYEDQSNYQNRGLNSQNALQKFADIFLRTIPNSAIVFSNRPDQNSSLYIGGDSENKRHHIFPYFLADAFKKRNSTLSAVVRYLENNVDYTSRRLHDRPQEIQAYGNLTINLAD